LGYNSDMVSNMRNDLGEIIRRQRVIMSLTLAELAERSGVSASHLGRIERGERFPSARILRRLAQPLGVEEGELMTWANYLSPASVAEEGPTYLGDRRLDPHVARMLSQEPVDVQRAVIGILSILKSIAGSMTQK
jgi:transcriptional regulator with XRE-family HTH domain